MKERQRQRDRERGLLSTGLFPQMAAVATAGPG